MANSDKFAPITPTFQGAAGTLEGAIKKAWDNAHHEKSPPGLYRILDISFHAENPITEYSVIIGHIGGHG